MAWRSLAYCLMPNHVHFILVPERKEALVRALAQARRRYSIVWSGSIPIRDAASYGCPSFAAPTGDRRWTLMGLIGSGMGLLAVTWSKPPAEHLVSRMRDPMCCFRWCGRQLCLRHMPISGVNSTPRPGA